MTSERFETLEPGTWRRIPGDGVYIERMSKITQKVWVWDGYAPVEIDAIICQRIQRIPYPSEKGLTRKQIKEQFQEHHSNPKPDLTRQFSYIASVLDDTKGWQNPFRDYFINSPSPTGVYKWSRSALLHHLLDLQKKERDEIEPKLRLVKTAIEKLEALLDEEPTE